MDKTLKRDSAPFHVAAAKNFASRAEATGLKRMDLLEAYAKRHGSKDWNAFTATGKVSLTLRAEDGSSVRLPEQIVTSPAAVFRDAALSVIEAAMREGMSCHRTGPVVLTDERGIASYHDFARVGGLSLSRKPGPGRVSIFRNLDALTIAKAAGEAVRGYRGVIIIDAFDATSPLVHGFLEDVAPEAIIIAPRGSMDIASSISNGYADLFYGGGKRLLLGRTEIEPPALRKLDDGMWTSRYFQLLEAFVDSRMDLDPANLPDIEDLDPADPPLARLLKTIPGYNPRERAQNMKAAEQFAFLLNPLRR